MALNYNTVIEETRKQKGLDRLGEIVKLIESYFVTTKEPGTTPIHHIDDAEWRLVKDKLLALFPEIANLNKLRDRLTELEKKLDDREEDLIEAKREERERIADELGEDIYNKIRHLQTIIEEHSWSRRQTNYDGNFISHIDKALLGIGNDLYGFRQALKEKREMSIAWDYLTNEQIAQLLACRPDLRPEYEKHKKGG